MTETSTAKIKLVVDNDNVCQFPHYKAKYRESVIAELEEMLERAREGEIEAVSIGYVRNNGAVGASWSEGEMVGQMLGSVALLQHRLLSALEEEDVCGPPDDDPDDPDDGGVPTAKEAAT